MKLPSICLPSLQLLGQGRIAEWKQLPLSFPMGCLNPKTEAGIMHGVQGLIVGKSQRAAENKMSDREAQLGQCLGWRVGEEKDCQTEERTVAESKYGQWKHRLSFTRVIKILCFFREKKKI